MFSERLRQTRIESGMSQKQLSEKLFVSQQSVAKWEMDKSTPNPDMLSKLSEIFGVSVDYLLGNTDEPRTLDQQLEGIDFALFGEVHELSDEEKQDILDYIRFKKQQKENK